MMREDEEELLVDGKQHSVDEDVLAIYVAEAMSFEEEDEESTGEGTDAGGVKTVEEVKTAEEVAGTCQELAVCREIIHHQLQYWAGTMKTTHQEQDMMNLNPIALLASTFPKILKPSRQWIFSSSFFL